MQDSMETLTGAVVLLNMFQVSIISSGATLILTTDVCSRGKIQTKHFLKEKSVYNVFVMDVQKHSPSAAGKPVPAPLAIKHILIFRKHLLGKTGYFLRCFLLFLFIYFIFVIAAFLLMPAALVVGIFWEVVSVSKSHVGVPLAISHSRPSVNHSILKKRGGDNTDM